MTIVKKERVGDVMVYNVKENMSAIDAEKHVGTFCTAKTASVILDHDADVYTVDGKLLLRFRKGVLPMKHVEAAYDNLIAFAKQKTSTRGATSGTEEGKRNPGTNIPIMSNIIGYFDKWTIGQKHMFKVLGIKPPFKVRVSSFLINHPEKWKSVLPLIQDIDRQYKKLAGAYHKKQMALANGTAYRIPKTAFTTVTINVNLQTACHTDSGDFEEGFGNLVVIERGEYSGGYTIFPQYGLGVDVRTGDFLAMDVHKVHGNVPIVPKTEGAIRMSLVCYLRQDVYNFSKGTSEAHVARNKATFLRIKRRFDTVMGRGAKGTKGVKGVKGR